MGCFACTIRIGSVTLRNSCLVTAITTKNQTARTLILDFTRLRTIVTESGNYRSNNTYRGWLSRPSGTVASFGEFQPAEIKRSTSGTAIRAVT